MYEVIDDGRTTLSEQLLLLPIVVFDGKDCSLFSDAECDLLACCFSDVGFFKRLTLL